MSRFLTYFSLVNCYLLSVDPLIAARCDNQSGGRKPRHSFIPHVPLVPPVHSLFGLPLIPLFSSAPTFGFRCLSRCCERLYTQCPASLGLQTRPSGSSSTSETIANGTRRYTCTKSHTFAFSSSHKVYRRTSAPVSTHLCHFSVFHAWVPNKTD